MSMVVRAAQLEALDVGKPANQPAMLDIPNAATTFRHFAGWADKIGGATIPTAGYFGRPTQSSRCANRSASSARSPRGTPR